MQEVPVLQALLQFVRFGLPWDFGRTITIADGEARPVVSPPAVVRRIPETMVPREAAAYWIARSEPGDDTANEKRRANSVQLRRSLPAQAGRAMKKHMAGSSTAATLSRRPPAAGPQDGTSMRQHQRRWMQLSLNLRRPRSGRLEGRGARSGGAEISYAIALTAQGAAQPHRGQISNVGIRNAGNTPAS